MSSENNNTANSLSELAEQASALGQKLSEHALKLQLLHIQLMVRLIH